MHKNLLIIFTRNPDLGKVKTRLAREIGDENALAVYYKLINHTREVTSIIDTDKAVFYDTYVDTEDEWQGKQYRKALQEGADLGERMFNALMKGKEWGYKNIGIIGTDAYGLTPEILNRAFGRLQYHDWVFGPAVDGGYYFVGCREPHREIFNLSAWSTDTVLKETLEKAHQFKLSVSLVDELNDIDTLEDLKKSPLWPAFEKILLQKPSEGTPMNASPVCYLDSEEVREEYRGEIPKKAKNKKQ